MTDCSKIRKEIETYCACIGNNPLLVQGAGGNVSWKEDGVLWVKASGTWLKDALSQDIFVPVDLLSLQSSLAEEDFAVTPLVIGESLLRPSIETLLHGLLPKAVVVHVHAIEVLSWMVRHSPHSLLEKKLETYQFSWSFVGYQKPGAELAREIAGAIKVNPSIDVVLMSNHGVVIGGDSVDDVSEKLRSLVELLSISPLEPASWNQAFRSNVSVNLPGYVKITDPGIEQLVLDERLFNRIEHDWALYPDHVVFLGSEPCVVSELSPDFQQAVNGDNAPEIIFIKNIGVYSIEKLNAAKLAQLRCYYDVMVRQDVGIVMNVLTNQDVARLLNWDAEAYRQSIAK